LQLRMRSTTRTLLQDWGQVVGCSSSPPLFLVIEHVADFLSSILRLGCILNHKDEKVGRMRTPSYLGIRGLGRILDCKEERRSLPPDPHPHNQVGNLLLILLDTMEYMA
jgi:hypothetical protein